MANTTEPTERSDWTSGAQDEASLARLVTLVQAELEVVAQRVRRGYSPPPSLETRELVSELFMRLVGGQPPEVRDHEHFFAIAARTMRWILVERHRRRRSLRESDLAPDAALGELMPVEESEDGPDLEALDLALSELAEARPRLAQMVELSYFLGLGPAEIAAATEASERTVFRDLKRARSWLHWRLTGGGGEQDR